MPLGVRTMAVRTDWKQCLLIMGLSSSGLLKKMDLSHASDSIRAQMMIRICSSV